MFRTITLSIIRSFSLYTQQWYMSYRFADSLLAGSGRNCGSVLILLASWFYYKNLPRGTVTWTSKVYVNNNYISNSDCTWNKLRIHSKHKQMEVVYVNNRWLFWELYETEGGSAWQSAEFKGVPNPAQHILKSLYLFVACQNQNRLRAKPKIQLNILGHNI